MIRKSNLLIIGLVLLMAGALFAQDNPPTMNNRLKFGRWFRTNAHTFSGGVTLSGSPTITSGTLTSPTITTPTITGLTTLANATSSGTITASSFVDAEDGGATLTSSGDSLTAASVTGEIIKTTHTFVTSYSVDITDAAGNGAHGSVKLIDFPEGYIKIIGVVLDADVTAGDGGIADDATYDIGLGSAAAGTDNAALATTEQDILNKIEGDLSSGAASVASYTGTDLALDGSSTAADCYLNIAIEADDCSADDILKFAGNVKITWVLLGDS